MWGCWRVAKHGDRSGMDKTRRSYLTRRWVKDEVDEVELERSSRTAGPVDPPDESIVLDVESW